VSSALIEYQRRPSWAEYRDSRVRSGTLASCRWSVGTQLVFAMDVPTCGMSPFFRHWWPGPGRLVTYLTTQSRTLQHNITIPQFNPWLHHQNSQLASVTVNSHRTSTQQRICDLPDNVGAASYHRMDLGSTKPSRFPDVSAAPNRVVDAATLLHGPSWLQPRTNAQHHQ
jgi:hypothetical protein